MLNLVKCSDKLATDWQKIIFIPPYRQQRKGGHFAFCVALIPPSQSLVRIYIEDCPSLFLV